jgi:PAS domain S-box-containing protein
MLFSHVTPSLIKLGDTLHALGEEWIASFRATSTSLFVVALVLALTATILVFMLRMLVAATFDGFLAFLRRCPPEGLAAATNLCHYLLGEEDGRHGEKVSTTRQIINSAAQGIICCDKDRMVDTVNEAVKHILGYSAKQLLGQTIDSVFNGDTRREILRQMEQMCRHECAKTYTEKLTCVKEDDSEVACEVTLLGMMPRGQTEVQGFVVLLKDVASLRAQQEAAEAKAKARSEQPPRDIANRIAAGETDIAMVVDCATVFFIDIDRFSHYCSGLSPR